MPWINLTEEELQPGVWLTDHLAFHVVILHREGNILTWVTKSSISEEQEEEFLTGTVEEFSKEYSYCTNTSRNWQTWSWEEWYEDLLQESAPEPLVSPTVVSGLVYDSKTYEKVVDK